MTPRDADNSALEIEATSEVSEDESDEDSSSDEESETETETFVNTPALRNARTLALMAEERWLIEKLKQIRSQRNSLKVEVLYYQGLKADLYANYAVEFSENDPCSPSSPSPIFIEEDVEVPIPELTYPELTPELEKSNTSKQALLVEDLLKDFQEIDSHQPSNLEDFAILEGECNSKELDLLNVNHNQPETWDMYDPESESDEEEAWSRVNIQMSMLVGNQNGDGDED